MSDVLSDTQRKHCMSAIKGGNTKPELIIRRGLHRLGFRFRLHDKKLPGRPDLVFASKRTALFVNGCFWHCHECSLFKWPRTRESFWRDKLLRNRQRDAETYHQLEDQGWRILVIWECALRGSNKLGADSVLQNSERFLNGGDGQLLVLEEHAKNP